MTALDPVALQPVALGLGAANGYAATDLTNPCDAALLGEVPYLPEGAPVAPLELRIHGVGGAPPERNLETPSTLQVGGDATAGFFRPWYPGGSADGQPHREAYCWGGINTRAWTRALWLLLVAFMLVNVSYWALPKRGPESFNRAARGLLRLLGLTLTVAFVTTAVTLLGDIVAVQAAGRADLPTWTGAYERLGTGARLGIALLAVLAGLGVVVWISVQTTRAYEKWGGEEAEASDPRWPLTHPQFWRGERTVSRQRYCHLAAASAVVVTFAALPSRHDAAGVALLWLAGVVMAVAVLLVMSEWSERSRIAGAKLGTTDRVAMVFSYGSLAVAAGVCLARLWWSTPGHLATMPGDQTAQTTVVLVEFGVVALVFVAVALQRPWTRRDVMAKGLTAPMLALFAAAVASIFGSSIIIALANLIGSPASTSKSTARHAGQRLFVPSTVFAGGLGMVVAVLGAIAFAIVALAVWAVRRARWSRPAGPGTVAAAYPMPGGAESRRRVAGIWAVSSLTDLAPVALTLVTLPAAAVFVGGELLWIFHRSAVHGFIQRFSGLGGTLGVLAIGFFFVQLRSALTKPSARKRFGTLWDVGTFWPRACHPFAPPCYAERSIPEVVTRLRRIVGDRPRGPEDPAVALELADAADPSAPREQHRPVLLTGYSQGTPISVAVLAQLPAEVRDRVALLTLAAPVHRLYGRAFPVYFGPVRVLAEQLREPDGTVRWRNTVRRSDYIGGPVLPEVDREIFDPPVLWPDRDPSPPPAHLHSDMFDDPQTRPYAAELIAMLADRNEPPTPGVAPAVHSIVS